MLTINDAAIIFDQLQKSTHKTLVDSLVKKAIRYAQLRVDWYLYDIESRIQFDNERTAAHNAFIDACNILSRNMLNAGEKTDWRTKLGNDRKDIGDFASLLHAVIGIKAR